MSDRLRIPGVYDVSGRIVDHLPPATPAPEIDPVDRIIAAASDAQVTMYVCPGERIVRLSPRDHTQRVPEALSAAVRATAVQDLLVRRINEQGGRIEPAKASR